MNRYIIINTLVVLAIVAIVAAVFVIEDRNSPSAVPTTTATTTTVPATTTSTTSTTTTSTTTTTTTSTTTTSSTTTTMVPPTTEAPLPRALWKVIVVNGSPSGERLQPMIEQLRELGYADLRGLIGAVQTPTTGIYYLLPGMEGAAERLRADLELDVEIAGFDQAPPVAGRNDAQLMLYLGGS